MKDLYVEVERTETCTGKTALYRKGRVGSFFFREQYQVAVRFPNGGEILKLRRVFTVQKERGRDVRVSQERFVNNKNNFFR